MEKSNLTPSKRKLEEKEDSDSKKRKIEKFSHQIEVNCLLEETTEEDLIDFFSPCGDIKKITKSRNSAIIEFIEKNSVSKALKLDLSTIKDVKCYIFEKQTPNKIRVSNLPNKISDEEFLLPFSKIGKIKNYEIKKRNKIGYVEYGNSEFAVEAIRKLNYTNLCGYEILVEFYENEKNDLDYNNCFQISY